MRKHTNTESASLGATRGQFKGRPSAIKAWNRCPPGVLRRGGAFWVWPAKLRRNQPQAAIYAVYEACGFGFGLQRQLGALGIECHVVCPQKLDERKPRVKTDERDAKALCLKLDRYVEGNQEALARVRLPSEEEEQLRAIHRQREQLVHTRKQLEAHGAQFTGQPWAGAGAEVVEGAHLWKIGSARMAQRIVRPHPARSCSRWKNCRPGAGPAARPGCKAV